MATYLSMTLLLGFGRPLYAELPILTEAALGYTVRHWSLEEGLPRTIDSIAQTPDGYLWLGTPVGLIQFDGERFELFGSETQTNLPFSNVRKLYGDSSGRLWIWQDHPVRLSFYQDGGFTSYSGKDLPASYPDSLTEDPRDGTIWMSGIRNG
ncbi:MAG: two-component regulator propeller domain-containing protein, partial [Verrucomicrobiota bacterium]